MFSRRFLRIKVVKAIYSHLTGAYDSINAEEKNLIAAINKAYDLYPHILSLIVDVKRYAEERIEIGLRKHLPTQEELNPNRKFVENKVVAQIENDDNLDLMLVEKKLGWGSNPELVKHIYNKMVASEYYATYMASEQRSYAEDRKFVEEFYLQTVQDDAMLCEILEDSTIMWSDDIDFILIMVLRTISSCKATQEALPLLPKYKSDDDETFVKRLFARAAVSYDEHLKIVEQYTKNWEVERIALMDNIILTTAIAELVGFDSIPVKVTLDEYIEIAKYYSTLGSSTFINGILDKITTDFTAEGRIVKQGRGLVEF
ncbi:MAG: transcription antitermination protein NusB [Tidjanibacter sp.]|nr:transcription antitermination protein NusB [Tidjanibacter sp.]